MHKDTFSYSIKYGAEAAIDQSGFRVVPARGQLELYDRNGRYSSEGRNASLTPGGPDSLRKEVRVRYRVDQQTCWQGISDPPQPVQIPDQARRSVLQLHGKYSHILPQQINVTALSDFTDDSLWTHFVQQASPLESPAVGNYFNGQPVGVVTFNGSARQFMSEFSRYADAYVVEDYNGAWRVIAPRAAASVGTKEINYHNYEIRYPLLQNYPLVAGIRNQATVDIRAVVEGDREDIVIVRETVPGGDTLRRQYRVSDDSIISVRGWQLASLTFGQDLPATTTTVLSSTDRITVQMANMTPDEVDYDFKITGLPSRITQIGTETALKQDSINSYGVRDATEELPDWYSYGALLDLNRKLDRLKAPLTFVRMQVGGWQATKADTDTLYGIKAGEVVRCIVSASDQTSVEETGVPDLYLNMLVMSVRYIYSLGRMPLIEFDLIEFPTSYDGITWILGEVGRSEWGTTMVFA